MTLIFIISLAMIMSSIFLLITMLISFYPSLKTSKFTPFECGFNPINSSRMSFSIQFFIISILFLVFDIEIILLLPLPIILVKSYSYMIMSILIIMILMAGLFLEWKIGSLKWN